MDSLRAPSKRQRAATKQEPQSQQMARSSVQSQDCTFSKMHVGEDPEGFLLGFESAATQSSLPREEWAVRLAPLLSGEAQAVYQALPYYTAEDYDQLKDALLNHLDVNEKNYRKKFRSLTFSAGTKPRSVARRLRNLGRKWLKPDVRSSEEIVELIIIEQFIQILPTDAEHWLSHQETSSLESIIQMAEEYLAGRNLCEISKEDIEEARRTTHKEGVLFKGAVINSQKGLMIDKGATSLPVFPKAETEEHEKPTAAVHRDTQDTVSVPENETRSKYDRRTLKELLQTKSVSTQVIKEELPDPEKHESCRGPMTTPVETGDDAEHLLPPLSAYGGTVSNFPTLKLEERQSMENRYICIECGKSFSVNPDSCDPRVTYSMEEPNTCAECKSQFSHSLHHIIEHQIKGNEGQYVCNECGRSFSGSAHLAIHKRKHTGERPFTCGKCGMTFSQQSNLVRHQKIHKDVKPYVCTECGKSFRRGFHLTRHQLTHTGEKPYNCERCGKRFSLLSNMLVHQKRKICYSHM